MEWTGGAFGLVRARLSPLALRRLVSTYRSLPTSSAFPNRFLPARRIVYCLRAVAILVLIGIGLIDCIA